MAVPPFQAMLRPMVAIHAHGQIQSLADLRTRLAEHLAVSSQDLSEILPSGTQRRFDNRVAWAQVHLVHAGLLERAGRGLTRITPLGIDALAAHPEDLTLKNLRQYPGYLDFVGGSSQTNEPGSPVPGDGLPDDATPEEVLERASRTLDKELAMELANRAAECTPEFFEQLVVDLLVAMGYGGSHEAAAKRIGASGDGGVDGVISEDRLGLDRLYVQAKRWKRTSSVWTAGHSELRGGAPRSEGDQGRVHHNCKVHERSASVR